MPAMTVTGHALVDGADNPFHSPDARFHSSYSADRDGRVVRLLDSNPPSRFAQAANTEFRSFVRAESFPCLGAKAALNRGTYRLGTYESLTSEGAAAGLARDLFAFVHERQDPGEMFTSFVAIFERQIVGGEAGFESALWTMLQRLHELDRRYHDWDSRVASDPADARFSFSIARTGFFVVGLSPQSSRAARRFSWPALVFNPHEQFEQLRQASKFDRLQQQIRRRDRRLDGSLNPNLAAYGEQSEARQYSGRAADDAWICPFARRP